MQTNNIIRAIGTSLTKIKSGDEAENWVVGSLTSIGEIGLEIEEIDITTLDSPDKAKEYMAGDMDAGELSIAGYIKKVDDEATVTKMMALIAAGSTEAWEVEFPSGAKWNFNAFVKSFKTAEATPDGLISFSGSLRVSGLPVYTASAGE